MLIILSFVLLLSFYLLARVCDEYFVPALDKIAYKWKLPNDVAGATLMAAGSSAPELFVAIIALVKPGGHEAVGAGAIVGSAIFNILVIIGASAVAAKKAVLKWQPVIRDVLFYVLAIALLLFSFIDGKITLAEAGIFVVFYLIYILVLKYWKGFVHYKDDVKKVLPKMEEHIEKTQQKKLGKLTGFFDKILRLFFPDEKYFYSVFFVSILIIAGLSWVLVESAVGISHLLGIPEVIIALTVLAVGTSIPDMISSIVVAKHGRGGMAISNAVGSNIFDILFGLGVPWLILIIFTGGTVPVSTTNLWSSAVLLLATVIVISFLLLMRHWKLGYKSGWFLIGLYIVYLVYAIMGG